MKRKMMTSVKYDDICCRPLAFMCFNSVIMLFLGIWQAANGHSIFYMKKKINQLLKKQPCAIQAIVVTDARTGKLIDNYHGNYRLTPASNMKLFTAAAALYRLGSHYAFLTTLSIQPYVNDGILNGNVYITFSGDPTLSTHNLKQLITVLKQKHIKMIHGNVIIDGSRFRSPDYATGWTQNSINWYYSAPITAISVNQNKVHLTLSATKKIGDQVKAIVHPYNQFIKVKDQITATSLKDSNQHCSLLIDMNQHNQLSLGGCWPTLRSASNLSIAIKNPALFVSSLIRQLLNDNHIELQGRVLQGITPNHGLIIIAKHQSSPLINIVATMLKQSNNFYAGSLIKTIGAYDYHVGNFNNGILAEKKILKKYTHVNFTHLSIFDGSGQSYYDHLQAKQIVTLLYDIYHSKIHRLFYNALAISGQKSGTLMYRMGNKSLRGHVHAKTGSMYAGNSSLSGYIYTAKRRLLIFSILFLSP